MLPHERDIAVYAVGCHACGMRTAGERKRLFVAIRVPAEVRGKLARVQLELQSVLPLLSTRWTKPENAHLTLRFLGNVGVGQMPDITRRLGSSLSGFGVLDLVCERLGSFPDLRFPRVIWAGVHDLSNSLLQLHKTVDAAVAGFGDAAAQNRFEGHITLARPKIIKPADAERLGSVVRAAAGRRFGCWSCSGIELIQSEPSPDGSRYTPLATINF